MKKVLTIVFAGLVTVGLANADITPLLFNVTPAGPDYTWNYEISIDSAEELVAGNYFTIYDIGGTIGTVTAPTGWTDSVQLTGITPSTQNPTDNAAIDNITFTYDGTSPQGPTGTSALMGFSFVDNLGSVAGTTGTFTYSATKTGFTTPDQGQGGIEVPTATPEPVTTGLIGLALVGMAVARRKFAR